MSFLQPLLWLGALAAAVPLWLHLRARTGTVWLFPAARFLDEQPRPRLEGVRPRDVPLLVARLAALLLAVAAFAWPYLTGRGAARVTESRVHVLDNTLSQQAAGGFAADRDRVAGILRSSAPDVQNAVIELTGRPRVVAAFADDASEAERRVRALAPSFERGSYLEAFRLAQSLLSRSLGQRKRIVVHSDQQENQWSENANVPPFLEDVEVEIARAPVERERTNLAVSEPAARLFFLGDRTFVDFSAQVRHGGGPVPARTTAVLEVGGRVRARQELTMRSAGEVATLRAQWETDPTAWTVGEVRIEGREDALAADDRASFCVAPVREGRVALMGRSPYLRAALSPRTMKGRWATQVLEPGPRLAERAKGELADVLVLEGDYAQSQAVRDLAFRYLNNERGVVLLLERATPLLDGFLADLGFRRDRAARAEESEPQGFRFVAGGHPIFEPFVKGELGDLTGVRVLRHVPLVPREAIPLIYGESGQPLLFEGTAARGRLLLFAFGFGRAQTDWPLRPSFLPFLDLCLQHARAAAPIHTAALPGELHVHDVPADRSAREAVLRSDGREVARAAVDGQRHARLLLPDRPGVYTITYDAATAVEGMIAVNPPPAESVLRYAAEPAALKAWSLPASRAAAPAPAAPAISEGRRGAADQRLWWWLLVAAGLALALETSMLLRKREA